MYVCICKKQTFMKHTFKINFYLKRSVIRKNGKMPVVMRIIINGERTDVHLPIDICSSMCSVEFGRASGKTDAYSCTRATVFV